MASCYWGRWANCYSKGFHELDAAVAGVGDAHEGFNGGAEYVRWVRSKEEAAAVFTFFEAHCDQVRVMPFLEGVPCSIHGVVFPDDQIALRPCEMLVARKGNTPRFHYAGSATFWDPPVADREDMRTLTYLVGAELRTRIGYRGVFTIDGVMTRNGFRPTELNPRFGGAIAQLGRRAPELPLELLHYAIVECDELDWRPRELEALLLELGDQHRAGAAIAHIEKPISETTTAGLAFRNATPKLFDDPEDEAADFYIRLGPGITGGFLHILPRFERIPVGPAFGPTVARILSFLDQQWSLNLGPIEAAKSVRE